MLESVLGYLVTLLAEMVNKTPDSVVPVGVVITSRRHWLRLTTNRSAKKLVIVCP